MEKGIKAVKGVNQTVRFVRACYERELKFLISCLSDVSRGNTLVVYQN